MNDSARSPRSSANSRAIRQLVARIFFGAALAACPPALAQPVQHPDILVTAPLPKVAPERSLDSADVEAYGLATVGELISEVAAENGESRDNAAFLINGKRAYGLGSVADLPAEAIVSIDVLPAGSGPRFGASPSQRVYSIRLRRDLDLLAVRAAVKVPTEGAWSARRGEISYTRIRGERRFVLTAKARDEEMLLESERSIVQPPGALTDAGRFRSLSPASQRLDISASAVDQLTPWLSGALNGKLSAGGRHALLGPFAPFARAEQPLDQRYKTLSASMDVTLNGQIGSWQASWFGNYSYNRARTSTDRPVAGAPMPVVATTSSIARSLGAQLNAFGPVLKLPAGPLILNLGAGVSRDRIEGARRFQNVSFRNKSTLTSTSLSAGIEVPIASRAAGILPGLGELSVTAELSRQHSSDFGGFENHILSLLWRPADWLSLTGSIGGSGSAPSISSLDDPPVETPGIRYFDPLRGETVDVTLITGGTPGLRRQRGETNRLAANFKPFRSLGLRITTEYFESRNRNYLSELPSGSLSIMQAFPQRFVRDGGGRLIIVDARPVMFASRVDRQLRTGFMLNLPLGGAGGRSLGMAEDDDDNGGASSRPVRPAGRSGVRPRLQVSVSHSWLLESRLAIRAGQPAINLLSREAIGFGGLGQPRHRFDASLGYADRGRGARLSVQSRGPSFIESSGAMANMIRFEPLTSFSLRAWVQGERLAPKSSWMRGTRLSLNVTNLTNVREKAADRFGFTPLAYQSGYRDPTGRSIEIELRKKF